LDDTCAVGAFLWHYHCTILAARLATCSSGGVGGVGGASGSSSVNSSGSAASGGSSSSSTYAYTMPPQQAQQQQLPLGALELLQHLPAMQLELLLLTEDIGCKVLLLQAAVKILGVCALVDDSLELIAAAKSALIQPLLTLVLPHVMNLIKQLSATGGSSAAAPTSSGSGSSSSASAAAERADALEQQLHAILLICINGGEQLLWPVSHCIIVAQAARRSANAHCHRCILLTECCVQNKSIEGLID
jgi:hypothetical protein